MTIYDPPAYAVSRLRYYDGEFLKELDFIEEQFYHVDRQQRHQRLLHVAGIAEGLRVTVNTPSRVTIGQGTALDDQGRLILLATDTIFDLPGGAAGSMFLEIAFYEDATGIADPNSTVSSETRFTQKPHITLVQSRTAGTVLVATLAIVPGSSITVDTSACAYSGARLPGPPNKPMIALQTRSDGAGAELSGSLYVDGDLRLPSGNIGIGASTPAQALVVSTGKVGIGYNDAAQTALLAVNGNVGVGTTTPAQALVVNTGKVGIGYNSASQAVQLAVNGKVSVGYNDPAQTAALAISGNVGVGITTPAQALVIGSGKLGVGYNDPAQTAALAISGNVGVGTTTPNQALVVNTGKVGIGYNDGAQTAGLAVNGNVGIGTSVPKQKLTVTGNVGIIGNNFDDPTQTAALYVIGNVGLGSGISAPAQQLVVSGNVGIGFNSVGQTAQLAVNGSVGIGSLAPAQALVVTGKVAISGYNDPSQTAGLAVNGSVGIGTIFPAQAFVVSTGKVGVGYNDGSQTAQLAINGTIGIGNTQTEATLDVTTTVQQAQMDAVVARWAYGTEKADLILNRPSSSGAKHPTLNGWLGPMMEFRTTIPGDTGSEYSIAQIASTVFSAPSAYGGGLAFLTSGGGTTDPTGRRGKGDAPVARLTIDGYGVVSVAQNLAVGTIFTGSTPSAALYVNGAVGIGTSAPAQTLVVNTGNVGIGYNTATQTAKLAVSGNVGIGTATPRSALDTDMGVITGAGNDYGKAQSQLCGGGVISWSPGGNNRLAWTYRFIAPSVPLKTCPTGYIVFSQPAGSIPSSNMYDGVARDCTGGVLLNYYEALWAAHTPGGNSTAITWYITRYSADFTPPSNWLLIATINGDLGPSNTIKLGTGVILPPGTAKYAETAPIVTAAQPDMKIMTGVISSNGTIASGTGFTVAHTAGSGSYTINFSTAFSVAPAVTCTANASIAYHVTLVNWGVGFFTVNSGNTSTQTLGEVSFSFIAVGPK